MATHMHFVDRVGVSAKRCTMTGTIRITLRISDAMEREETAIHIHPDGAGIDLLSHFIQQATAARDALAAPHPPAAAE